MGRPRSFDEQAVLDAVAAQFRVHGFADSSTESLCEAAGVRRSSLYNAFESKEELFVQALERYTGVASEAYVVVLATEELTGLGRLQALLEMVIAEEARAASEGHAAGCMVVNSYMAPDLRARDPRIARALSGSRAKQLAALAEAVREGQLDGTVRPGIAADDAALLVQTVISGLRITAQTGATPATLSRVAALGLAALKP